MLNAIPSVREETRRCTSGISLPSRSGERRVLGSLPATSGLMDASGRGWVVGELGSRASRAYYQLTPAVRTDIAENTVGARRTEGALERADASVGGLGRQVFVATLTAWPEFEHSILLAVEWMVCYRYCLAACSRASRSGCARRIDEMTSGILSLRVPYHNPGIGVGRNRVRRTSKVRLRLTTQCGPHTLPFNEI